MLAQKDEYIRDAANTIYQLSQDEMIRLQCEAREDYYLRQRSVEHYMQEQCNKIQELQDTIQTQQDANQELRDTIQAQQAANKDLWEMIAVLQAEVEHLKNK